LLILYLILFFQQILSFFVIARISCAYCSHTKGKYGNSAKLNNTRNNRRTKSSSGVRVGQTYTDGQTDGWTDGGWGSATRQSVRRVGQNSRHAQLCGPVFTSIATFIFFFSSKRRHCRWLRHNINLYVVCPPSYLRR